MGRIIGLEISDQLIGVLALSWENIAAAGALNMSWPKMYLEVVLHDVTFLDEIMDLHLRLSTRMVAHLQGIFINITRCQYQFMSLLSPDATKAQVTARILRDHLVRLRPGAGNYFEEFVKSDLQIMGDLERMADSIIPYKLWRGRGASQHLYRFVATRFLANGDSVVPVEGIHGRWKKVEKE